MPCSHLTMECSSSAYSTSMGQNSKVRPERTKTPIMMMENCCYDRFELLATAMARAGIAPRDRGEFCSVGYVSAVLEGANGRLYRGVNIDLACGLGFCAERSAAVQAVGNGDREFIKIAVAVSGSRVKSPCGICRQFLAEMPCMRCAISGFGYQSFANSPQRPLTQRRIPLQAA